MMTATSAPVRSRTPARMPSAETSESIGSIETSVASARLEPSTPALAQMKP